MFSKNSLKEKCVVKQILRRFYCYCSQHNHTHHDNYHMSADVSAAADDDDEDEDDVDVDVDFGDDGDDYDDDDNMEQIILLVQRERGLWALVRIPPASLPTHIILSS